MDEASARALAEEVAADLCRARYETVHARFEPRMKKGLSLKRLREVSARELGSLGTFETIAEGTKSWTKGAHTTVIVRCAFDGGWAAVQVAFDADARIVELFLRAHPGGTPAPADAETDAIARVKRALLPSSILMLAVPVVFVYGLRALDEPFDVGAFILGIAGWTVALALRAPVGLLARRFARARAASIVIASSGPLEETLRWVAVGMVAAGLGPAFSLGIGWASVEVLFTIVNAVVAFTLAGRSDPQAAVVREMLAQQGMTAPASPFVGVIERISATAYHVGAALLLAVYPLALAALIVVHSVMNLMAVRYRTQLLLVQLQVATIGGAIFAGGLAAFGRI